MPTRQFTGVSVGRGLPIGAVLAACTVAGGLAAGLLSAYWWDSAPEDMERWGTETVVPYSALGAIAGLFIGGLLIALTLSVVAVGKDPSKWRFVPIWSGAAPVLAFGATFGAAIVLVPVPLFLTAVAARRTEAPCGIAFRLGLAVNALFAVLFVWTIGIVVYDTWVAPA
jgi:hypothetical protein